ncbi:MAG: hypothetical protein ACNS63_09075 [Candidatus Nitrospinota bacterium M3_3B_026]
MKEKRGQGAVQDYLKELSVATGRVERFFSNKPLSSADLDKILEYAGAVEDIHRRLQESYDFTNGGSRILEQFFNEWNNMVFGVFYTADLVEMNRTLTAGQYDTFLLTIRSIQKYIDNFGVRKG